MNLSSNFVQGTCMDMCPREEIEMRECEMLLHPFEILIGTENDSKPKANKKAVVKSFSRSAAGKKLDNEKCIRPPKVLLETVAYLLTDIVDKKEESWITIYDFVLDRLRAVRQDLVIQNAPSTYFITVLQPIVRFHAYSAYRCCEMDPSVFDQHLNNMHLQECLKRLLCAYDDVSYEDDFLKENRSFFESMYIVLNLGIPSAITRGLTLHKTWKSDLVLLALEISLAHRRNNFYRICKMLFKLPTLHVALVWLQLPQIRRKALKIMSLAYSSKNVLFPCEVLSKILLHNSIQEVLNECKYYGLNASQDGVSFLKTDFNDTIDTMPPKKHAFINNQLDKTTISQILLYNF